MKITITAGLVNKIRSQMANPDKSAAVNFDLIEKIMWAWLSRSGDSAEIDITAAQVKDLS